MNNNFVKQIGDQNPLDGVNVGDRATPKLIDFDGDGDLDVFIGEESGTISFLENVGDAATPEFIQRSGAANPFDGIVISEERSNPAFADWDGDGAIDAAVVGNAEGTLRYFTYDGDRFTEQIDSDNPFNGIDVGSRSAPALVDLNGDGALDLVVGEGSGNLNVFLNDGAGFTAQTGSDNPFDGVDVGNNSTPAFKDLDRDGDLDAFVGTFSDGTVNYFENTGTAATPEFVQRLGADNPFKDVRPIKGNVPTLGDLNGDGDLDALIGGRDGNITYLANGPSVSIAPGGVTPTESGTVAGSFVVTLSQPAPSDGLTIQYTVETRADSATAGVDYQPLSGSVTVAPGETTAVIEVTPIDDGETDPIETVTLSLSAPDGYLVSPDQKTASLAIADNEGDPLLAKILNEPNFKDQWYLRNTVDNFGTPGVDLNVLKVWQDYSGKGVKIGVVERGLDTTHPDLAANYDPSGPVGDKLEGDHGSSVAGIIAAEAGNGLGGVGVAFNSTIRLFDRQDKNEATGEKIDRIEQVLSDQVNVDISNNSWGRNGFVMDFRNPGDPNDPNDNRHTNYVQVGAGIRNAVANGRDGLGTVYVSSAGNERDEGVSANYSNLRNSRYTIAVASLDEAGRFRDSSSPGANLLISAFGENIFSTDVAGELGNTPGDYTFGFGGTSAAAPMVTGVAALMLEANPQLGYRDVQEILAYSAKWTDTENESWGFNGAANWNGGGLHYSLDYGFGQVDALAAVRLAETWQTQHTAANEQHVAMTSAPFLAIPDDNTAGISNTLTVEQGLKIDHVEVDLEINHDRYEDLIVTLTSPTGVVSELVNRIPRNEPGQFDDEKYDPREVDGQDFLYTFSSTFNWGETGVGDWTLNVVDAATGNTGVLNHWTLNLYGDAITADDTYIYTNDFARVGFDDPTRQTLSDTNGGNDTLNAAAVTSDLNLDLSPGKTSAIAGKSLHIAADTQIEQAFGGDGNDRILGNRINNALHGGRGDDKIYGGRGDDQIWGGKGNDLIKGQRNNDKLWGDSGDDKIYGGRGDDEIYGGQGKDTLFGNAGDDRLSGKHGDDILRGGGGADILTGGRGADILTGGGGADILDGGRGADILTGGAGRDTFVFENIRDTYDTITDFELSKDVIDVSSLLKGAASMATAFQDYVKVIKTGSGDAKVKINSQGDQFETIATLSGVDATALETKNFIFT